MVAQSGANGIGLLRTEFLFMNRDTVPTEDEQADIYRSVVETMAGDPVTIRVLDWGGEKEIEALVAAGLVPEIGGRQPGARPARHPAAAAAAGAVRNAARRHPARRRRRAGPRAAADGDQRRRAAGGARDLSPASPRRCAARGDAAAGQAAAARHHGRDAGRGAVRRRAGRGGRVLRHRHQRSVHVHAGGRPRRAGRGRTCTTRCTRRCCG